MRLNSSTSSEQHASRAAGGPDRRVLERVLLAICAVALATVVASGAAFAHGAEGNMTVISAEPASATEIKIEIGLVYTNDDELATEATVVATLTGPDGTAVGPVDLRLRTGAIYETTVAVPATGTWTVDIESAEPTSSATAVVEVTGQAPATSATSTSLPSTTLATSVALPASAVESASSSPPWVLIVAAALVILGAGALVSLRARRTNKT